MQKIHDVKQMLEMAAGMETGSVKDYNDWANLCSQNADSASKKIFEALADDKERYWTVRQRNGKLREIWG